MKRGAKESLRIVLSVLFAMLFLSCGGGGGGDNSDEAETPLPTSGGSGWIKILSPTETASNVNSCNFSVSGEAFISIDYSRCCPVTGYGTGDYVQITGVTVTWENLTTGRSGQAMQFVDTCIFFFPSACTHEWWAHVPLRFGTNTILMRAIETAPGTGWAESRLTVNCSEPNCPPSTLPLLPMVTAHPGGGTYGAIQTVTLAASQPATIFYTLDGSEPDIGAAGTRFGASPVTVALEGGTTTLRFFATGAAGAPGPAQTETYVIDLVSPNLSLVSSPPEPLGLLARTAVAWKSDEAGTFLVELGGTDIPGSGTVLISGMLVGPGVPVSVEIPGRSLSFSAPTTLRIFVTDAAGHTGSTGLSLSLKPLVVIPVGEEVGGITILPDGKKAYLARVSTGAVTVIDTEPASSAFNTVVSTIPVGTGWLFTAATPDSGRVYVTNHDTISSVSTTTDSVTEVINFGGSVIDNIAVSVDGTRAYYIDSGKVTVLDIDAASPSFHHLVENISFPGLISGDIAMTPDGSKAVVNGGGMLSHTLSIVDIDPLSPTYHQVLAAPVPVAPERAGGVAISSDGAYAFATDVEGRLCKIDLRTNTIVAAGMSLPFGALALSPDGETLLFSKRVYFANDFNNDSLLLIGTKDLALLSEVALGPLLGDLAITPDGSRAYVARNVLTNASEVVMVPLH